MIVIWILSSGQYLFLYFLYFFHNFCLFKVYNSETTVNNLKWYENFKCQKHHSLKRYQYFTIRPWLVKSLVIVPFCIITSNRKSMTIYNDFLFSTNNYCWCVIIDYIFSDAYTEQWPNYQLTVALPYNCLCL